MPKWNKQFGKYEEESVIQADTEVEYQRKKEQLEERFRTALLNQLCCLTVAITEHR